MAAAPLPTINVVPAGYKYSTPAAQKAAEKGAFIRVGGTQISRRFLSGAQRSWASNKPKEAQTVFSIPYRITGTLEDIRTALQYAGLNQEQMMPILAGVITRENYNDPANQAAIKAELALHAGMKKQKEEGGTLADNFWNDIVWYAENAANVKFVTKTGETKGVVVARGGGGTRATLQERYAKLPAGKVLNVSEMDMNTGKGAHTINALKTARSGKFGVETIKVVSNNIDKYVRALELIFGPTARTQYGREIELVNNAINNARAQPVVAAPIAAPIRAPSPPRVPGATLAAIPVPRVASPRKVPAVPTVGVGIPRIPQLMRQ